MNEFSDGEIQYFTVTEDEAGIRIDKVLLNRYKDMQSRTYFQFLIQNNHVLVNNNPVKKQFKVKVKDNIEIHFALTPDLNLEPQSIPLNIIYEDSNILVVNKSAGMVVHPAPGNWTGTFVNALLYHCNLTKEQFANDSHRPGIVHRLDKDTSGLLIAAKDAKTQQRLIESFATRNISKEYLAICCGNPGDGEIEAPIGRHPYERKLMCIRKEGGRHSISRYQTLATDGKISAVKIQLITGRTHQIRVHMKHIGFPVLGDSTYGNVQLNKRYNAKRQLLHAYSLELFHPISGEKLIFKASFPEDIKKKFDILQFNEL